jgi:hypothetical protein
MQHFLRLSPFILCSISLAQSASLSMTGTPSSEPRATPLTFHVATVRHQDLSDCDPAKCTSTKFTVEGYSTGANASIRTVYVLTCTEVISVEPHPHISMACSHLHANAEYSGKLFDSGISFWPEAKYEPPPYRVLYEIVSETESR